MTRYEVGETVLFPPASLTVPRASVKLPVRLFWLIPAIEVRAADEMINVPAPSFTKPAVPVSVLLRFRVLPVSTWKAPWTAPKATTGTLKICVVAPVASKPPEVRVS